MSGMRPAIKIKVELFGQAMKSKTWEEQVEEVAEMLLDAVDLMHQGYKEGQCRDSLGNTALWYEVTDAEEGMRMRGRNR